MKLNIYSIYDTASGLYCRPFFTQSDAEAVRSFKDISTDADHPIGKHPEDYTLFRIGLFDDTKGTLANEDNESLATALELVASSRTINRDNLDLFENNLPDNVNEPDYQKALKENGPGMSFHKDNEK